MRLQVATCNCLILQVGHSTKYHRPSQGTSAAMHGVFDGNTPCLMSIIKPSFILSFTGQVWHVITGEARRADTIKPVVETTRRAQRWHKKSEENVKEKEKSKLWAIFSLSLSIFTESRINLSGSLTASAASYAASALKRVLCLFAVKCDQAPHMINEAFAGNVRGGDQAHGRDSSCFALSGKQKLRRRVSFFFPPPRHDERSVVCCAALHICFRLFLFFSFSWGTAILSLKRLKPSLFFPAHIPNGVAG